MCSGLSGVWLTQAYINLVLVLFVPATILYKVEQQAKHSYLERRCLVAQWGGEGLPWAGFAHLQAIVCVVLLAVLRHVLEIVILKFQPYLRC